MLVYEKIVDGERHLFGTEANVPSDDDVQLTYKNDDGDSIEDLTLTESYLDDGRGGIIRASDNEAVNVFIGSTNIIPGSNFTVKMVSIEITTDPTTTTYSVGDTLDLTGMVVTANFNDGSSEEISDYTASPADGATLTAEDIEVTVSYNDFTDKVEITVS